MNYEEEDLANRPTTHKNNGNEDQPVDPETQQFSNKGSSGNKVSSFNDLKMENIRKLSPEERIIKRQKILSNPKLMNHFLDVNFNMPVCKYYFEEKINSFFLPWGRSAKLTASQSKEDVKGVDYYVSIKNIKTGKRENPIRFDLKTICKFAGVNTDLSITPIRIKQTNKNGDYIRSNFLDTDKKTEQYAFMKADCPFTRDELFEKLFDQNVKPEKIQLNSISIDFVPLKMLHSFLESTSSDLSIEGLEEEADLQWKTLNEYTNSSGLQNARALGYKIIDVHSKPKIYIEKPIESIPGAKIVSNIDRESKKGYTQLVLPDTIYDDKTFSKIARFK